MSKRTFRPLPAQWERDDYDLRPLINEQRAEQERIEAEFQAGRRRALARVEPLQRAKHWEPEPQDEPSWFLAFYDRAVSGFLALCACFAVAFILALVFYWCVVVPLGAGR